MTAAVLAAMIIILSALAAVFVFYPVRHGSGLPIHLARHRDRVAVYEARRKELAEELELGHLDVHEHHSLQQELDRQLLNETRAAEQNREFKGQLNWRWAVGLLAVIVVSGTMLYWQLGARQAVELYEVAQTRERSPADFDRYLTALDTYVNAQSEPDIEHLFMLADGYSERGRYEEAVRYYERTEQALRASPEYDPEVLSAVVGHRGQVRFILANRTLTAEVEADFLEALRLDPLNTQALATLGMAHFEAGSYDDAIAVWERFLSFAPEGRTREAVLGALEQARRITSDESGEGVPGVQVLFSALPADLPSDALIYIVARPVGAQLPVAIQRYSRAELPVALRLTDQDRSPEMSALSEQDEVEVVAFATPADAPDLSQATHRTDVVRTPTSGNEAVVTLTFIRMD